MDERGIGQDLESDQKLPEMANHEPTELSNKDIFDLVSNILEYNPSLDNFDSYPPRTQQAFKKIHPLSLYPIVDRLNSRGVEVNSRKLEEIRQRLIHGNNE